MTAYYIYLISAGEGNPVKVGMATNASRRLNGLQISSFVPLVLVKKWRVPYKNIYRMERTLHLKLRPHHVRGEWFSCKESEALSIIENEMLKTENGKNMPLNISPKPLLIHRSSAGRKGGLIGAAAKKAAVEERAKAFTKAEWVDGSIKNAQLVEKYDMSINTLRRIASDRGWGHDRQRAIWRAEGRKK